MKHQTYTSCLVGGSSHCERMTSPRQSQQHRIYLLSPKQRIVFVAWKVRTMYEQGKASMVVMEMRRHNNSLLGIAETKWIQTGQFRLSIGELLLHSGHTHNRAPHTEGIGFMLSRQVEKALIGWQPVSSRLMTAIFRTKQKGYLFDWSCAHTVEASDEVNDQFYERLKGVLGSNRPERELTILMGDMNTKIGNCNIGYAVMGTHGIGNMNNDGERFADFCAEQKTGDRRVRVSTQKST